MLKMDITGKGVIAIFLLKMHILKNFWSTPPSDVLNSAKFRSVCGGGGVLEGYPRIVKGGLQYLFLMFTRQKISTF